MSAIEDKIFYNESSSVKLGWKPGWFGVEKFDQALIEAIEEFQEEYEDLKNDGLCGPKTYRRIFTLREAQIKSALRNSKEDKRKESIICNGKRVEIDWPLYNVITMGEADFGALPLESGFKTFENGERKVTQIVLHWDAALSAESCHRILKRRGLSAHFTVDNDGVIFQMVDCNHVCWHAPPCNFSSIGIEISNAVYKKYQNHYLEDGFGPRPIIPRQKIHGKRFGPFLGFYDIQMEAVKALVKSLAKHYNIPINIPLDGDGKLIKGVLGDNYTLGNYKGILCHYHIDMEKIDPLGFPLKKMIAEIKKERSS